MSNSRHDELRRKAMQMLALLPLTELAKAQDALIAQPQTYRLVLENSHVRVLGYTGRPGMGVCGNGLHSHPAHLGVVLSDGRARERLPNGHVEEVNVHRGEVFWSEAITHETENIGGQNIESLLIELKGVV
ncbi:MAG TPA: hypothetical protein VMF03_16060 [Steroidobacteraceae bacterium]|nr:hypothetical protein [Steroidobacteraceae bacterium]